MGDIEKLRDLFSQLPPEKQPAGWEDLWEKKVTPWDRKAPSPALIDVLKDKRDSLPPTTKSARKRVLVPGCGAGYDVLLFASYGYDAWGLDTAPTAIKAAKQLQQKEEQKSEQYICHDKQVGVGKALFLVEDFFKDDFLASTGGSKFDVIYDYTFLCALHPDMRPGWAKRMSELLAVDGILICLEFPLSKPPSTGGPPHGLTSELYVELLKTPGEPVAYDKDGYVLPDGQKQVSANGLRCEAHMKPARSHDAGRWTDMVSLWEHVRS